MPVEVHGREPAFHSKCDGSLVLCQSPEFAGCLWVGVPSTICLRGASLLIRRQVPYRYEMTLIMGMMRRRDVKRQDRTGQGGDLGGFIWAPVYGMTFLPKSQQDLQRPSETLSVGKMPSDIEETGWCLPYALCI